MSAEQAAVSLADPFIGLARHGSPSPPAPPRWLRAVCAVICLVGAAAAFGQTSPELAMRDFSSGQIKKGVRSIGFGGDGASWGNYGLVWRDAGTGLVDYGDTTYANGNDFHFEAVGATTPPLWHDLAVYLIAMTESTNDIHFGLRSPGLGPGTTQVAGHGIDDALFSKIALPLGHGVSAGVLLSYETSHFDASSVATPESTVRYETRWRPSGGFGIAWQPTRRLMFGFRALLSNDLERRIDALGTSEGLARSAELRLGGSVSPWEGALIDIGATRLEKTNAIAGTQATRHEPNVGLEQTLFGRRLTLRLGVDETSPTAGLSVRLAPFNMDVAYVRDMAHSRVGELFGARSDSVLVTFTVDYDAIRGAR